MNPVHRLGVYGGAFDPPHNAHVALALAAVDQLQLDELRVFPTGNAWHKLHGLTSADHRLAMANIAFGSLPHTEIDDRELWRVGPTYTIDTLRELQDDYPGVQLFLVLGEDQAVSITRWREWEAVLKLADLCVAPRPNAASHSNLAADGLPPQAVVRHLRMPPMDDNATEIRARVATAQGIAHLVPPGVASYIASNHLYEAH